MKRQHHSPDQFSLFDPTVELRHQDGVDGLPASAQELVSIIGLDATIDLVKRCGGDELKIPENVGGSSRVWALLVETIGEGNAGKLVDRYAGTPLYIAKCATALRDHRNQALIARLHAGEDFDSVRRSADVSRRHLWRLLAQARPRRSAN
ncbi:MAG: hypothetical protein KF796_19125 [Ramlibacter sp.]|nr:hypothetical protein [Ramlibacter sp.]